MPNNLPHLNRRAWGVATRWSPVIIQVVLAMLVMMMWLLGEFSFIPWGSRAGGTRLIVAALLTTALVLPISAVLLRKNSASAQGIGLSGAALAATTLLGGIAYAIWPL